MEGLGQYMDGMEIGLATIAALQRTDRFSSQAGFVGELFLRQPGTLPIPPEQITKWKQG
jgi:hypothetical protein